MITAKASRTAGPDTNSAENFVLKSDPKKSRLPFIIGAAISAVALYIKSVTSPAEAQEYHEDGPAPSGQRYGLQVEELPQAPEETRSANAKGAPKSHKGITDDLDLPAGQSMWLPDAPPAPAVRVSSADNQTNRPALFVVTEGGTADAGVTILAETGDIPSDGKSASQGSNAANKRNKAPQATRPAQLSDVASGAAIIIALTDLLAHMHDPEGDTLAVHSATVSSGRLIPIETGFVYVADPEALGPVNLQFTVTDGHSITEQVAHFTVLPREKVGTNAADMLAGSAFRDQITGLDGNDYIDGMGGSDILEGGAGDDSITGGDGDDKIFGGSGNDKILGGNGHDEIHGGAGNDILFGDAGNDLLYDGTGTDKVYGGAGNDTINAAQDTENDVYDGGEGQDTLDYSASNTDLTVDLVTDRATGPDIGTDTISNFEIVILGSGNDHVVIGAEEVALFGGAGDNTFEFIEITPEPNIAVIAHQISDFNYGDVIKSPKYYIFEKVADESSLFDALNENAASTAQSVNIRYRHETYEDEREDTIIEWDNDDCTQMTIVTLNGHHILIWENHS